MDLGSAIIGAIFLVIGILPFMMMSRGRKNREKKFLQSLLTIATKNNCQIDQHDVFAHFAIGFDNTKKSVIFYRQAAEKVVEHFVAFSDIQSCKVLNTSKNVQNNNGTHQVIDKLELSFIPLLKSKPEIKLEFFNANVTPQLYGELQSIQKWSTLVNDHLNQKQ
jgi:hypothetical protein